MSSPGDRARIEQIREGLLRRKPTPGQAWRYHREALELCDLLASQVAIREGQNEHPENALRELLAASKDSSTIHFDEDTVPHGQCADPIHCDCMCPGCWALKVAIIRRAIPLSSTTSAGPVESRANDI